jgi:SAM-dependent methyltransferase
MLMGVSRRLKRFRRWLNERLRFSIVNPTFLEINAIKKRLLGDTHYFKGLLVDVGCGEKPYYKFIRPGVGRYIGLEVGTTCADIRGKVDVLTSHFSSPFKDESLDTILLSQVLEHTYEPVRLLASVRGMLKRTGYLIATAPKTECIHEIPYDYFRYTPYSLELIFRDAGYEVLSIEPVGTFGEVLVVTFLGFFARKLQYSSTLSSYLLKAACIIPFTAVMNCLGLLCAPLLRDDKETLDYRVVARRKL